MSLRLGSVECDICGKRIKRIERVVAVVKGFIEPLAPKVGGDFEPEEVWFVVHEECWYDPDFAKIPVGVAIELD